MGNGVGIQAGGLPSGKDRLRGLKSPGLGCAAFAEVRRP